MDSSDLLVGRKAIIRHLCLGDRQGDHMITRGEIPTFKLGGRRCATKSGLQAHFDQLMANAGRIGPCSAELVASVPIAEIVELRPPRRLAQHVGDGALEQSSPPRPMGSDHTRQRSPKGRGAIGGTGESLESNCQASGDPSIGSARTRRMAPKVMRSAG